MLRKLNYLFMGLLFAALYSCQSEEPFTASETSPGTGEAGAVPVQITLGLNSGIETSTGYEPLRTKATDDEIRICITNLFKVIVAKEIGNKWILERIEDYKIDPNDRSNSNKHHVTNSSVFHHFNAELTPGTYKLIVFTGSKSMIWNDDELVPGIVLDEPGNPAFKAPYACGYRFVANGYLNPSWKCLEEEIFYGQETFVVEKTEDLHSGPLTQPVHVQLDRKVGKFRIALRFSDNPDSDNDFFYTYPNGISADFKTRNNSVFCKGLDVWGNPYYDTSDPITQMKFGTFCKDYSFSASVKGELGEDGYRYLIPMYDSRQRSVFYFTDPERELELSLSDVEISANPGMPTFVYANPYFNMENPIDVVITHNTTTGLVFRAGTISWEGRDPVSGNNSRWNSMELITDSQGNPLDATKIFSLYYEYK